MQCYVLYNTLSLLESFGIFWYLLWFCQKINPNMMSFWSRQNLLRHGHSIPRHCGSPMHAFWHSWLHVGVPLGQNHLYGFHLFVVIGAMDIYGWLDGTSEFAVKNFRNIICDILWLHRSIVKYLQGTNILWEGTCLFPGGGMVIDYE